MNSSIFDNTPAGQFIDVKVSIGGKTKTRNLKLCKVKPRSVLFILIDKENRVNTFYKIKYSDIAEYLPAVSFLKLKPGVLPDKWESAWDSIGSFSPSVQSYGRFASAAKPHYSNHSKGWAPVIKAPMGSSMDALAVSVSNRSTTNSTAGFPMV